MDLKKPSPNMGKSNQNLTGRMRTHHCLKLQAQVAEEWGWNLQQLHTAEEIDYELIPTSLDLHEGHIFFISLCDAIFINRQQIKLRFEIFDVDWSCKCSDATQFLKVRLDECHRSVGCWEV